MFTGLNLATNEKISSLNSDKQYLHESCKNGLIVCIDCSSKLYVRSGTKRQHFYHENSCFCSNTYHEPETEEHINGKILLYEKLKELYPKAKVELEFKVDVTNQRSDVMVIHENNEMWAFEFQCSKIKYDIWNERHSLYANAGIHDFWVLGESVHTYGFSEKEVDNLKHKLCGLEKAIFDSSSNLYYLDTDTCRLRVIRADINDLEGAILYSHEWLQNLNSMKIKDYDWYTEEDQDYDNNKNTYTRIVAYRIVDYYYSNSKKYREGFFVHEACVNGEISKMWLENRDDKVLKKINHPITIESKKLLLEEYNNRIKYFKTIAIVDSPMKWELVLKEDGYMENQSQLFHDMLDHECVYPRRYIWWEKEKKWFLPKKNKDINWNKVE